MILCGDQKIHMDYFTTAIRAVRDRLNNVPVSSNQNLARFHDSPALRLIDTVAGAPRTSAKVEVARRRIPLEALVYQSTYSETTDPRDNIYALLNLATDVGSAGSNQVDYIVPDYSKPVLDVFVDFILHCCLRSGHLDIICRPWAPVAASLATSINMTSHVANDSQLYPSWIATKDRLPFGNPSWRSPHRLHGIPLVSRSSTQCYFAHYGSRPKVTVGRQQGGFCDGSLRVKGLVCGEIAEQSARMADAIITKECVNLLRRRAHEPEEDDFDLPDVVWRTLCADRDGKGERAPYFYPQALLHLLEMSSQRKKSDSVSNLMDSMSSIDPEELLDTELPESVERYLMVVRDVIWNRRTFCLKSDNTDEIWVGLAPQRARIGDKICILYGCSVPVVLREQHDLAGRLSWKLIGDAYVHGIMDGEAISRSSSKALRSVEVEFTMV